MPRPALTVPALLLGCVALAGCGSGSPYAAGAPSSSAAAAPATGGSGAGTESTSSAPASPTAAGPAPGGGTITFTGALSGSMTVSTCHDQLAQLVVTVDGQDQTYNGLIDADDFTFAVPHSTGYTLADGTTKPRVSGKTYTVKNTKLVSITNDDTVTANGSVTCP